MSELSELFEGVKDNPLFRGVDAREFESMLPCVQGRVRSYPRGGVILLAGDPVKTIGLVLSGVVQVLREDREGRQSLLAEFGGGELFGEVFACAGIAQSPVTVLAAERARVLHIDCRALISVCSSACAFHQRIIENLLALVAQKNLLLNQKIEILSRRTTRERLLLYFDLLRNGAERFTVPYSREELAAYLCVDRSALSAELSKMQRDGLIRYRRNSFTLLCP